MLNQAELKIEYLNRDSLTNFIKYNIDFPRTEKSLVHSLEAIDAIEYIKKMLTEEI